MTVSKSVSKKHRLVVLLLVTRDLDRLTELAAHRAVEVNLSINSRIRAIRGGKLNDPRFGSRMHGEGILGDQVSQMFNIARRKAGIPDDGPELSTAAFRRPEEAQLGLGRD